MERFWHKVAKNGRGVNDCWEWCATKIRGGYGHFWRNGGLELAHRVAFLLYYGPFDETLDVLHSCDNPGCCNPHHLFIGTHADNMADRDRKGRTVIPPRLRGESCPWAKIDRRQRDKIISEYAAGGISQRALGERYGISQSAVSLIIRGVNWKC